MLQCHVVIFMKNTRSRVYDVVVAGGGAAGLVASIVAARRADVLLIEYNDVLGKKFWQQATVNAIIQIAICVWNIILERSHLFLAGICDIWRKGHGTVFPELGIEPSEKMGFYIQGVISQKAYRWH